MDGVLHPTEIYGCNYLAIFCMPEYSYFQNVSRLYSVHCTLRSSSNSYRLVISGSPSGLLQSSPLWSMYPPYRHYCRHCYYHCRLSRRLRHHRRYRLRRCRHSLENCPRVSAIDVHLTLVNNGTGNGRVPPGNEPFNCPIQCRP